MFIDYVALMLINLVAGLVFVAFYVYRGLDIPDQKHWVPGFAMSGFVALATGLHMIWNWPLPGSYNIAIGDLSVLFGIVFLGTALALAMSWRLDTVAGYAFFAGIVAILIGAGVISRGLAGGSLLIGNYTSHGLTAAQEHILAGIGYILAGLSGVFAPLALYLKENRTFRTIGALVLLIAALIWAIVGYGAYWTHLSEHAGWVPLLMK